MMVFEQKERPRLRMYVCTRHLTLKQCPINYSYWPGRRSLVECFKVLLNTKISVIRNINTVVSSVVTKDTKIFFSAFGDVTVNI